MRKYPLTVCAVLFALSALLFAAPASGGEYPTKTVRMIVGYAPGGGTDVMARAVAKFLEDALGKSVVVVNKPGANGQIATADMLDERPDGYTIIMLSSGDYMLAPLMSKDPGYTFDDFKLIASFNDTANCVILKKDSPFKTFADLVAFAKENPGKVTLASSGFGHLLFAAIIEKETGIKVSPVGFGGGGESLNALLGGHVDGALINMRFIPQAAQHGCTAVGVASQERFSILPDVPTFVEQGYNITDTSRRVLAVTAKTPQYVADALAKAVLSFGDTKEFDEKLTSLSEVRKIDHGPTLEQFMKTQTKAYAEAIEANRDKFPTK